MKQLRLPRHMLIRTHRNHKTRIMHSTATIFAVLGIMLCSAPVWSQTAGEIDWDGLTVERVEELFGVGYGVRIYRKHNQGRPPFLDALNNGVDDPEVLSKIMELEMDSMGESAPIEYVFQYTEHPQIVRRILSRGIDPNERISKSGRTALHNAVMESAELTSLLIEFGARVDARTSFGTTPLFTAARFTEDVNILRSLVENGADVAAQDSSGKTPIFAAAQNPNPEALRFFIDLDADVSARNEAGMTPFIQAAISATDTENLEILIAAGADPTATDTLMGQTALHYAAAHNETLEVIQFLLDSGIDLEAKDELGNTALMIAARFSESQDVVSLLLDAGANPSIENALGRTLWQRIQQNEKLQDTDVYWRINELRFE